MAQVAVTPHVSSLGAGAELTLGATPTVNVRLAARGFSITRPVTYQGNEYDAELTLRNIGAVIDLHPFHSGLRISAGAIYNDNRFIGRTNNRTTVEVNGVRYPVALVGRIDGEVTADALGPYAGIGWGNAVAAGGRYRLTVDLGAFYQGRPQLELTAVPNFGLSLPQRYLDDLEVEEQELENDLSRYRVLPVVSIGVAIRLGG